MARKSAERAAHVAHMRDMQECINYAGFANRQAGVHQIAARLRGEQSEHRRDQECSNIFRLIVRDIIHSIFIRYWVE